MMKLCGEVTALWFVEGDAFVARVRRIADGSA